jgi:hypothetical protein
VDDVAHDDASRRDDAAHGRQQGDPAPPRRTNHRSFPQARDGRSEAIAQLPADSRTMSMAPSGRRLVHKIERGDVVAVADCNAGP